MVGFAVHFQYLDFQLFCRRHKRLAYLLDHRAVENLTPVFCRKDKVNDQFADTVSAGEIPLKRFMYTHLNKPT